jgi:predicted porin
MKRTSTPFLLVAAVLAPGFVAGARAETDTVDVQSRAGVSLDVNLPKRWRAEFEYENRRFEDLATFRGHYFTVEGGYKLAKGFEALASYRFVDGNGWTVHRYGIGLEYEVKGGGAFRIGLRPILQYRTKAVDDDDVGGDGNTYLRTRLRVDYRVARWLDAYASVEPYFVFGADFPVDNWKDTLGLKFRIAKGAKVDVYYIYRPDYGESSYNRLFHVLGVELRLKTKFPAR